MNLKKQQYKFIDLFAGIGGMRWGFEKLNCQCVFSSEIDKFACQTYEANWKEKPQGDICKIAVETIPNFDILLAGFPCQPFSVAGQRKGFEDLRGTLFFEIIRILKFHRPPAFLLENVKGLISHNQGRTFQRMLKHLEKELKYQVFYQVLNAKDYQLPQNRQRLIIVGFLNQQAEFSFPDKACKPVVLKEILLPNAAVDFKYTLSDNLWKCLQQRKVTQKLKGNGFGYGLVNEKSAYTNTLSARYYKDGAEILIEQPNQNPRKLTPREAGRLQGFPDSFVIPVSDLQAYKQFGNSVPVPMLYAVAKKLLATLKQLEKQSNE